jgi:hypothetical protein
MVEGDEDPLIQAAAGRTYKGEDERQDHDGNDQCPAEGQRQSRPLIPEGIGPCSSHRQVHDLTDGESIEGAIFDVEVGRDLMATVAHGVLL